MFDHFSTLCMKGLRRIYFLNKNVSKSLKYFPKLYNRLLHFNILKISANKVYADNRNELVFVTEDYL